MNRHRVIKWTVVLSALLIVAAVVGGGIALARTPSAEPAQGRSEDGILIASVPEDGPAATAGVVRGDILLEIDGQPLEHMAELVDYIQDRAPGDEAELTVLHGDELRTLTVTLGEQNDRPYLGIGACGGLGGFGIMEHKLPFDPPHFDHGRFFMHPEIEDLLEQVEGGVVVRRVTQDGPAAEAGLQRWDVVTALDGEPLSAGDALPDALSAYEPGDQVTLTVYRLGEEQPLELEVTLGEHPEEEGTAYLGLYYLPMPRLEGFRFGHGSGPMPFFPEPEEDEMQRGVVIIRVTADSPAAEAGLDKGDVITALDGQAVESPKDLVEAIDERAPGERVTLTVSNVEDKGEREVTVTLAENPDRADAAYLGVRVGNFYRGFFRHGFFGEDAVPEGMGPFHRFFGRDQDEWRPFRFRGRLQDFFREMPFDSDQMPEDFEFPFPSDPFEESPWGSEDDTV